jgi:hypothetical protein
MQLAPLATRHSPHASLVNKTNFDRASSPKDILLYVAAYLLWFVNILVCAEAIIQIVSTVDFLWAALKGDRYVLSLINQATLLVGGFIAFVFVISLEHTYRACVDHEVGGQTREQRLRTLLRHFARTTAIPLGVIIVLVATIAVAARILLY